MSFQRTLVFANILLLLSLYSPVCCCFSTLMIKMHQVSVNVVILHYSDIFRSVPFSHPYESCALQNQSLICELTFCLHVLLMSKQSGWVLIYEKAACWLSYDMGGSERIRWNTITETGCGGAAADISSLHTEEEVLQIVNLLVEALYSCHLCVF